MTSESALPSLEQYRRFYAEEIRAVAGLFQQPLLVEAFAQVPREKFLGPAPWQIYGELYMQPGAYREVQDPREVYHNVVIALKKTQSLNNGQPGALAAWIAALHLAPGQRVFHVGCGTGYYTAIMTRVVGSAGAVVAAEIEHDLAQQAAAALREYPNAAIHARDGADLDPGPCDAIFVNAGVTHPHLPWLERLNHGGRMVLPLTTPMAPGLGKGLMICVTRRQDRFSAEVLSMVAIYSSASVRDPALVPQINKAFESRELLKMKSVRVDPHEPADTCLVHSPAVCISSQA
jgi:protein-L-isoaspartate(D-aspartate) O-methyltransferase